MKDGMCDINERGGGKNIKDYKVKMDRQMIHSCLGEVKIVVFKKVSMWELVP